MKIEMTRLLLQHPSIMLSLIHARASGLKQSEFMSWSGFEVFVEIKG
jgi:hypothetical protein